MVAAALMVSIIRGQLKLLWMKVSCKAVYLTTPKLLKTQTLLRVS